MSLSQAFTQKAHAAWAKLYGLLSSIMVMGTRQAANA